MLTYLFCFKFDWISKNTFQLILFQLFRRNRGNLFAWKSDTLRHIMIVMAVMSEWWPKFRSRITTHCFETESTTMIHRKTNTKEHLHGGNWRRDSVLLARKPIGTESHLGILIAHGHRYRSMMNHCQPRPIQYQGHQHCSDSLLAHSEYYRDGRSVRNHMTSVVQC